MQQLNLNENTAKIKGPHFAKVLKQEKLAEDIYKISLENELIAKNAIPGQFVSILCKDLVLRRPFSIANAFDKTFEIIYKVKGNGTNFISQLISGDKINLIGPLGNGYSIENKKSLIIGCGVGIAPILFLSKHMSKQQIDYSAVLCSQTNLNIENEFKNKTYIITEDNTSSINGRLDKHLDEILTGEKPKKVYICGPNAAMKYVVETCTKNGIKVEAAMEREFACGTGVCMGCIIKLKQDKEVIQKRICKDGPVFNGENIVW